MESEPFGRRIDVAEPPHLQLPESRHLEQVGPFLCDELDANADRIHTAPPQLIALAIFARWRRSHLDHHRTPVRQLAVPVAIAILVAELVEQRLRGSDI